MYEGGYAGKILRINLTEKTATEEALTPEMAKDFMGGAGFGIKILFDEVTAGTDPGIDRFRITADDGERPVLLMPNPKLPVGVPEEVEDLRWTSAVSLEWSSAAGAALYHVYRGALAELSCDDLGECRDDLDPDPTDLVLVDPIGPLTGAGFFYLVTSEDAGGNESILGVSSCGIRVNPDPCP